VIDEGALLDGYLTQFRIKKTCAHRSKPKTGPVITVPISIPLSPPALRPNHVQPTDAHPKMSRKTENRTKRTGEAISAVARHLGQTYVTEWPSGTSPQR